MSLDGKVAFVTGGSGGLGRVHPVVWAECMVWCWPRTEPM